MSAVLRVHQVLRDSGLERRRTDRADGPHPERIEHAINEVWSVGDYIVRINPVPGAHRLQDEARLLLYLPAGVRGPVPVAAGAATWGEWVVTVRLPGEPLALRWSSLSEDERRRAITDLGCSLSQLHGVTPPAGLPMVDPERCPHPLPATHLLRLLAEAADLPGGDRKVFGDAAERLVDYAEYLDPVNTGLVHGDLHLENVLAGPDGSLSGMLDFEWSRPGPPDLDLDILLQSMANPDLHHQATGGHTLQRGDFDAVVGWLGDAYPGLFAHPHLAERLWIYRLAYDVSDLLGHSARPTVTLRSTPAHHPYQRIVRHVESPTDRRRFLPQ